MISSVSRSGDETGDTLGTCSLAGHPRSAAGPVAAWPLGATGPGALMVFASGASYLRKALPPVSR